MRVDWCVSSWFRIKNTHSLTHATGRLGLWSQRERGRGDERRGRADRRAARVDIARRKGKWAERAGDEGGVWNGYTQPRSALVLVLGNAE